MPAGAGTARSYRWGVSASVLDGDLPGRPDRGGHAPVAGGFVPISRSVSPGCCRSESTAPASRAPWWRRRDLAHFTAPVRPRPYRRPPRAGRIVARAVTWGVGRRCRSSVVRVDLRCLCARDVLIAVAEGWWLPIFPTETDRLRESGCRTEALAPMFGRAKVADGPPHVALGGDGAEPRCEAFFASSARTAVKTC